MGYQIGDKVRVRIPATHEGKQMGMTWTPQRVATIPTDQTTTRDYVQPDGSIVTRSFRNPHGAVVAKHVYSGLVYFRGNENFNFVYPDTNRADVVGLDIDEAGNPIDMETLITLAAEAQSDAQQARNPNALAAALTVALAPASDNEATSKAK